MMFALVSVLLLGSIGFYLYQSLEREIAWRDDQALLGRLERVQALINDSASIEQLRNRPKLYENMLGNSDNLLWIVDESGQVLIEINPVDMTLPKLPATAQARLGDGNSPISVRLAWKDLNQEGRGLTLIAGKLLSEREQMLAAARDETDHLAWCERRVRELDSRTSLLALEEARRSALSAEITETTLQQNRVQYWIALYKAVGGQARDPANPQFTDHYFTGDYPTPGGNRVCNKALLNYLDGKNVRGY